MMESGCSCDAPGEREVASLYRMAIRRANKDHQCEECLRVIARGSEYESVTAVWDGAFATIKTCITCAAIRRDYGCGVHGSLRPDVWECLGVDIVTGEIMEEDQ